MQQLIEELNAIEAAMRLGYPELAEDSPEESYPAEVIDRVQRCRQLIQERGLDG